MKRYGLLIFLFFIGMSFTLLFSQEQIRVENKFEHPNFNTFNSKTNELTIPKRRLNLNIKRRITPVIGYKFGGDFVLNGDSAYVHSVELGAGLIHGHINEWSSWGPLPTGWDWRYFTLPFVTLEYRFLKRFYHSQVAMIEERKFSPIMLNVGVSGGIGGLFILIPAPLSINGMVGLSTDFNQLYGRARIGYDIMGLSVGFGMYYSLTKRKTVFYNPNYSFIEISFRLIRDN